MESWRNRKTLILGRTDMMGLLTPVRVQRLRRARVPHARPRARLHGAEGPHRPRPLPGRVGGHAVLDRGARGRGLQVGLDPRGQRALRAAGRLLDPRLHASGDGLPARDLRRLLPHAHAHGRVGRGVGQVAARQDSKVLAIVGAGSVGQGTLATCEPVFPWEEVRVWSRTQEIGRPLPRAERARRSRPRRSTGSTDLEQVVRGADVVVTGTHARRWIVDDAWISPGTHLAALGADLEGEQELDPRILQRARVFVDDIRQCRPTARSTSPCARALITRGGRRRRDRQGDLRRARGTPVARTRSRSSTPPASRCRTPRRCRSSTSARSPPASASRRR